LGDQAGGIAGWADPRDPHQHYRKHGGQLGITNADDFDASARKTIEDGRPFTYRDPSTGEDRTGYYDPITRRFTAVTDDPGEDEQFIVTHFECDEQYVRDLPDSTYWA